MAALTAAAALSAAALGADRDFTLNADPVFTGLQPTRGCFPIAVTVSNRGDHTRGVVRVTAGAFEMDYPIEVPRGAEKRLIVYPKAEGVYSHPDGVRIELRTPLGGRVIRYSPGVDTSFGWGSDADYYFVLVGDTAGEMTFLRTPPREVDSVIYRLNAPDAYAKPGELPDRPYGYSALAAVVMGGGSERMTDAEVRAIKSWLLSGGNVIFIGGASAPVLADARWKGLLPVSNLRPKTILAPKELQDLGGSPPPAVPMSLMVGDPRPGARTFSVRGTPLIVWGRVGLGQVVYLAFDPFEPPINVWKGRRKLFRNGLGLHASLSGTDWLTSFSEPQGGNEYPGSSYYNPYADPYGGETSPFDVQLPSFGTVFLILALYFLAVVPANYFILRKFRIGEKAWLTAPILSLAFAGAFFALAGSLYSQGLATATEGVVVLDSQVDEGYFLGRTQMFFPQGGAYDLGLKDVDRVHTQRFSGAERYSHYGDDLAATALNAEDIGEIRVPRLRVSNLSFREIWFGKRVQAPNWLRADLEFTDIRGGEEPKASVSGAVYNRSPYTIRAAKLRAGGFEFDLGEIGPGESVTLNDRPHTSYSRLTEEEPEWYRPDFQPVESLGRWTTNGEVALIGKMVGLRPGPQLGIDYKDEEGVWVICFFSDQHILEGGP